MRPIGSLIVAGLVLLAAATGSVSATEPRALEWAVVSTRPHDADAYTQGLVLDAGGMLLESTGLYGSSSIRIVDPLTGRIERSLALPDDLFGEGLARIDDTLVQLTWRAGLAIVRDGRTLEPIGTVAYEGEGWGLCYDGDRLVMSDGSDTLRFRDPETLKVLGSIVVTVDGGPIADLNELECVEGRVWANVYRTDTIVRIDPTNGHVDGVLDLTGIIEPHPAEAVPGDVLNGIAWDPDAGTFLVTGKRWPTLFEIRVDEAAGA